MITCELCKKSFKNLHGLGIHLWHSHKDINHKDYYDTYMKKESDGICPVCGKPTRWKGGLHGYARTCSISCGQKHEETRHRLATTNLSKYGVVNPSSATIIREKIKQTNKKRYGVENTFCIDGVNKKAIKNSHKKESEEKRQQTNLKKYGNKYHIASEVVRKKSIQTYMNRYGVTNAYSIEHIHTKAVQNSLRYKNNGNDSSWETKLEQAFIKNNIAYKKQYNLDDRYPFRCDFYLPQTDTFIEINGFWMHGGHWFNSKNSSDLEKLLIWKTKATTCRLYESAVQIWTKTDVKKREIARKNKLNYVVLWTLSDINEYIQSL